MLSTRSGSGLPLLFVVQGRFVTQCLSRLSTALTQPIEARQKDARRPATIDTPQPHSHTKTHHTHAVQVRTLKNEVCEIH